MLQVSRKLHAVQDSAISNSIIGTLTPYMKIQNFSLSYGKNSVLTDINLSIPEQAITSIIGPSGCGKTSFLYALTRITDLIENVNVGGEVFIENENILDLNTDLLTLRRKIGMIYQKPTPFPFSIRKNFEIPLKEHGVKSQQAIDHKMEESLRNVGLWNEVNSRLHKNASTLSGGQQQRLCIARALALQPKALLMDEPCSALDPVSTNAIEELLLQLRATHTIVIVTHNLAQAKRISDYTACFWPKDGVGHLIEFSKTSLMFSQPKLDITRCYVGGHCG